MTIIASYQKGPIILLAGDLVVSGGREQAVSLDIPTRFHPSQAPTNPYFVGLSQKVFTIAPDLAVAWAGSKIVAKHLLRRLASEVPAPRTGGDILAFIANSGLSENDLQSVSFIFFGMNVLGDTVNLFVQDYLTGETILGSNEKFKYAGSGRQHFFDSIGFKIRAMTGAANDLELATHLVLGRMAVALYEEIVSGTVHNFFYGGGFEILTLVPGPRFMKVPLTFAFWREKGSGLELVGPILSLNYSESGRLTVHRLTKLSSDWVLRSYLVSNLLNEWAEAPEVIAEPDFDTLFTVHYLISDKPEPVRFLIKKGTRKNLTITYASSNRQVHVEATAEFFAELASFRGKAL